MISNHYLSISCKFNYNLKYITGVQGHQGTDAEHAGRYFRGGFRGRSVARNTLCVRGTSHPWVQFSLRTSGVAESTREWSAGNNKMYIYVEMWWL